MNARTNSPLFLLSGEFRLRLLFTKIGKGFAAFGKKCGTLSLSPSSFAGRKNFRSRTNGRRVGRPDDGGAK